MSRREPGRRPPSRGVRALARGREALERWAHRVRRRRAPGPPGVVLELPRSVPGALVRLAPAVLVVACTAVVTTGGTVAGSGIGTTVRVLTALAAVVVAGRPRWPVAALFTLLLGFAVLAGGDLLLTDGTGETAGPWRLAALVLAVHLLHRVTPLAAHVAWGGRVETAVLVRTAQSLLRVQLACQALVLGTVLLRAGAGTPLGDDRVRAVAVGAVVVLAVVLHRSGAVPEPAEPAGAPSAVH